MLFVLLVACCDSCFVYHVLSFAFFQEWVCVPTVATVCVFVLWQVFPNYTTLMNNGNEKAKMATKKNTLALISFFVKKCIVFMQNMCSLFLTLHDVLAFSCPVPGRVILGETVQNPCHSVGRMQIFFGNCRQLEHSTTLCFYSIFIRFYLFCIALA